MEINLQIVYKNSVRNEEEDNMRKIQKTHNDKGIKKEFFYIFLFSTHNIFQFLSSLENCMTRERFKIDLLLTYNRKIQNRINYRISNL